MFRNAVTGDKPNNNKFSICSKSQVAGQLSKCVKIGFSETKNQSCGNYKVEDGEECDSGFNIGGSSFCCTSDCRLNKNATNGLPAQCDGKNPNEHACCQNCRFQNEGHICRESNQCMEQSVCSGDSKFPQNIYSLRPRTGKSARFAFTFSHENSPKATHVRAQRINEENNHNDRNSPEIDIF